MIGRQGEKKEEITEIQQRTTKPYIKQHQETNKTK
jgi:hypothetical protein